MSYIQEGTMKHENVKIWKIYKKPQIELIVMK